MTVRSWFYVGLGLLGVHQLVSLFVGLPALVVAWTAIPAGAWNEQSLTSFVGTPLFQLLAGLFLVRKAGPLADLFERRAERAV